MAGRPRRRVAASMEVRRAKQSGERRKRVRRWVNVLMAAEKAAEAAKLAAEAEERRLADPAVQKEIAYHKDVDSAVRSIVLGLVDSFAAQALVLEAEAPC